MAGTNGNTLLVENGGDVMGMDPFEAEGDDTGLLFGGAENTHSWNRPNGLHGIGQELLLIGIDHLHANALKIVDRGPKPNATLDMRCSRLKFAGKGGVDRLLEGHRADHIPTPLIGGHGLE